MYFRSIATLGILALASGCRTDVARVEGAVAATFEISRIEIVQRQPRNAGARWVLRACMVDSALSAPMAQIPVHLKVTSGSERKTTDSEGCVSYSEELEFSRNASESYFRRSITVEASAGHRGTAYREYGLNPWRLDATALWDSRDGAIPELSSAQGLGASQSRLVLSDGALTYQGHSFEMDANLGLNLLRRYQFRSRPGIEREVPGEGVRILPLDRGHFKFRILILTPEGRILAGYEGEQKIVNGTLVHLFELPFAFRDSTLLQARNRAILELEAIDEPELGRVTVSAPIILMEDSSWRGWEPFAQDVSSLITAALGSDPTRLERVAHGGGFRIEQRVLPRAVDLFRDHYRLRPLGREELHRAKLTHLSLGDWTLSGNAPDAASTQEKLCELFAFSNRKVNDGLWGRVFGHSSEVEHCKSDPTEFLYWSRSTHTSAVDSKPRERGGVAHNLTLNASFAVSRARSVTASENQTVSHSVGVEAGIGLPTEVIGIELGVGYKGSVTQSYTWSYADSRSWSQTESLSHSTYLVADEIRFEIDAEVQDCVSVLRRDLKAIPGGGQGLMYCAPQRPRKVTLMESWYHVYEPLPLSSSVLRDHGNLQHRPFNRVIRGRTAFDAFVSIVQNPLLKIAVGIGPEMSHPQLEWNPRLENTEQWAENAYAEYRKNSPNLLEATFPGWVDPKSIQPRR